MDSDGWTHVTSRNVLRETKNMNRYREITSIDATRLQKKLNIALLADTLMSEFSQNLQKDGWRYYKVMRPTEKYEISVNPKMEYILLDIPNMWNDKILFKRYIT